MTCNGPNPRKFVPWDGRKLPETTKKYRVLERDGHYLVEVQSFFCWWATWDSIGQASTPDEVIDIIQRNERRYTSKIVAQSE